MSAMDHRADALRYILDPVCNRLIRDLQRYKFVKRPPAFDLDLTATEIPEQRALPAPKEPKP